MTPKITAITPTYGGKYLERTIDSVLNQTLKPFEYCITVDGKQETFYKLVEILTQKGCDLIQKGSIFEGNIGETKVKILNRKKNKGIATTLNDCIFMSTGDFISWCSDDDEWVLDKLQIQYDEYCKVKDHEYFYLYGGYDLKDKKTGRITGGVKGLNFEDVESEKVASMTSCWVNFSTTLIPRKVFEKVGLFAPEKRFGEDYEWLMRSIVIFDVFVKYIDKQLVYYGVDVTEQTTHQKAKEIAQNDEESRLKIDYLLYKKNTGELDGSEYYPKI